MPITKQQSDRCITHHHACDCREWLFQEVVEALKDTLNEAIDEHYASHDCDGILANARAVLAKVEK